MTEKTIKGVSTDVGALKIDFSAIANVPGNLKGEKGDKGDKGDSGVTVDSAGALSIDSDGKLTLNVDTATMSVDDNKLTVVGVSESYEPTSEGLWVRKAVRDSSTGKLVLSWAKIGTTGE